MDSLELLPQAEILERLRKVKAGTPKALEAIKASNQHIIRLADIALFLGIPKHRLYDRDAPRSFQKELSYAFCLLEKGELIKVEINGHWQLIRRHQALEKVVTPQGATPPQIGISVTEGGPRLRLAKVNGS